MNADGKLRCDMHRECPDEVTHIDVKGFVYCTKHGRQRRFYQPCRQMTTAEIKQLQSGVPLARY
jgi:hypothetical protein